MKNFYRLSPREAYQYFIHHQNEVVPAGNSGKIAVSVIITSDPDQEFHPAIIQGEVENNIRKRVYKDETAAVLLHLENALREVSPPHSGESQVIYANENFSALVTLPIESRPQVVVGTHFDTRPLIKARQQTKRYYILVVSKKKIRLIEAMENRPVKEVRNDDFPFIWEEYHTMDHEKPDQDVLTDTMIKEFFNISDKRFRKYMRENPFPVILTGDVKMMAYYNEMMDDDKLLIGKAQGNYINKPVDDIVGHIYPVVKEYNEKKDEESMKVIQAALVTNRLVTDRDEIARLAMTGNTQVLFVGDNYSLKGKMAGTYLIPDKPGEKDPESTELISDIITYVLKNGGKVIFVDDEAFSPCRGMALVKRY